MCLRTQLTFFLRFILDVNTFGISSEVNIREKASRTSTFEDPRKPTLTTATDHYLLLLPFGMLSWMCLVNDLVATEVTSDQLWCQSLAAWWRSLEVSRGHVVIDSNRAQYVKKESRGRSMIIQCFAGYLHLVPGNPSLTNAPLIWRLTAQARDSGSWALVSPLFQ